MEGWSIARQMLHAELSSTISSFGQAIALINGYEIALALWSLGRRFRPARLVVALDATPALTARWESQALRKTGGRMLNGVKNIVFSPFAGTVAAWLPISKACRQSLVEDYRVDADRCFVTRSPQPSLCEAIPRGPVIPPYKLLLVGNDLKRKGAPVLIEAFSRGLMSNFCLTLVSNDPSAWKYRDIPHVSVVTGISDPGAIAQLYRDAHLQVLPTQFDNYSHVISEGLAQGLPFIATRVGGVSELIDESNAGWDIPTCRSAESLAAAIRNALHDSAEYAKRAESAQAFARSYLTLARFDQTLSSALTRIRN